MLPLGLGGLAVAGGLAYYLSSTAEPAVQETTPALIDVKTKESTKKQNEGKPTKKAVASASSSKRENENETPEHRVSVIEFPPGMRNTGAAAVNDTVPAPHPEGGNRVRGIGVARTPTKVEDASMTAKAIAKLQSEQNEQASRALVESHQSAWTDATNFNDLDSLSETQLKARIVQLATEIKDRTKWEAVRLKEFLAMKEKETADKYVCFVCCLFVEECYQTL